MQLRRLDGRHRHAACGTARSDLRSRCASSSSGSSREGTDGIVPCGTTGEGATLTRRRAGRRGPHRVEVVPGPGQGHRRRRLQLDRRGHRGGEAARRQLGADAALVVTPYYNKPTQEGLYRHYMAIWDADRLPGGGLQRAQSRTSVDLLPETVARLVERRRHRRHQGGHREHGPAGPAGGDAAAGTRIAYLSGDDFTVLPYIACGGHGVISVVGQHRAARHEGAGRRGAAGRPRHGALPSRWPWPSSTG